MSEQIRWPCIDPKTRRYTGCLGSRCPASGCWAGAKPVPRGKGRVWCKQCQRAFVQAHPHQRYCSQECYTQARNSRRRERHLQTILSRSAS
ncbi:hypothetical protein [Thermobaculum terrenum]|uniref:hypothetical protein n=1 Tax=Thermobaculum terrenum TaxID=166501 RepID=UPI0011D13D73|nr:hypothetical protein [Thermobaculum terrenum]